MGRDDILAKLRELRDELSSWCDYSRAHGGHMNDVYDTMAQLHDELSDGIGRVQEAIEKDPEELAERRAEAREAEFLSSPQLTGR